MLEPLKRGLKLVLQSHADKEKSGGWVVYRKSRVWYILTGHGINFLFLTKTLPELILPSPHEQLRTSGLESPEKWPLEYHVSVQLWLACLIEYLHRERGFSEGQIEDFIKYIGGTGWEQIEGEVKELLLDVPCTKEEQLNYLGEEAIEYFAGAFLDKKELAKKFREINLPIIYIEDNFDAMLAQMCIWGFRQTEDAGLYEYLWGYINSIARDSGATTDLVKKLWEEWSTPLFPGSFHAYIREFLKHYDSKDDGQTGSLEDNEYQLNEVAGEDGSKGSREHYLIKKNSKTSFMHGQDGYTVKEAAAIIGCEERTLYYWLQKNKITGCVQTSRKITEQLVQEKREYIIDEEGLKQARELHGRKFLVPVVAQKRGVGQRAAQRWVKRRIESGRSIDEIYYELKGKR